MRYTTFMSLRRSYGSLFLLIRISSPTCTGTKILRRAFLLNTVNVAASDLNRAHASPPYKSTGSMRELCSNKIVTELPTKIIVPPVARVMFISLIDAILTIYVCLENRIIVTFGGLLPSLPGLNVICGITRYLLS